MIIESTFDFVVNEIKKIPANDKDVYKKIEAGYAQLKRIDIVRFVNRHLGETAPGWLILEGLEK